MRIPLLLSIATFAALTSGVTSAQTRPDFSGRWTIAPPAAVESGRGGARTDDMGSGWGSTITISQTDSALKVEWAYYSRSDLQPPLVFVYPLDGSEKTNTLMLGRGFEKQVSRTSWDGAKLVITTTQDFPNLVAGQTVKSVMTRTLTLESPTSLVVETVRSGVLGAEASTTRTVYTKG